MLALARLQLTGDQLHERRLAGAVRAEQAGDAGRHGHRDVVQADHLAVPLRQVIGDDHDRRRRSAHATTSTPRTRRSSTSAETRDQQRRSSAATPATACRTAAAAGRSRRRPASRLAENDSHENARAAGDRIAARRRSPGVKKISAGVEDRRRSGCCSTATTAPASSTTPSTTSMNANTRDRRKQEDVVLEEREVAGERDLHDQQHDRRHPGDQQQKRHQDRELAEHVLGARQRLRQIDLQRVGAPIVGDQPGADVDGDEEHEDLLLLEELPERFGRRREQDAACGRLAAA